MGMATNTTNCPLDELLALHVPAIGMVNCPIDELADWLGLSPRGTTIDPIDELALILDRATRRLNGRAIIATLDNHALTKNAAKSTADWSGQNSGLTNCRSDHHAETKV